MNVASQNEPAESLSHFEILNGLSKETGRQIWVVELIDSDGGRCVIDICDTFWDVYRHVVEWEG